MEKRGFEQVFVLLYENLFESSLFFFRNHRFTNVELVFFKVLSQADTDHTIHVALRRSSESAFIRHSGADEISTGSPQNSAYRYMDIMHDTKPWHFEFTSHDYAGYHLIDKYTYHCKHRYRCMHLI